MPQRNSEAWSTHFHWRDEECLNGVTHGIGCLLAIAGTVLMCSRLGDRLSWPVVSCLVFCLALIGVYGASTLSHLVRNPKWRNRFRAWDQGLIFILIVSTYSPIAAALLSGWWQGVTVLMWAIAILGFLSKVAHWHRIDRVRIPIYVMLGWIPIVSLPKVYAESAELAKAILAGGIVYTVGAVILAFSKHRPYMHVLWHVLVILGSIIHYYAIVRFVVPVMLD